MPASPPSPPSPPRAATNTSRRQYRIILLLPQVLLHPTYITRLGRRIKVEALMIYLFLTTYSLSLSRILLPLRASVALRQKVGESSSLSRRRKSSLRSSIPVYLPLINNLYIFTIPSRFSSIPRIRTHISSPPRRDGSGSGCGDVGGARYCYR